jgi:spore coat polysaccharide biosynthesis protein SpsF
VITAAIIQTRMGSSRLPGKIMKVLEDKTVLGHVITRVKACPKVDKVVIATTTKSSDDIVATEAAAYGASVFRGSEDDVLDRYYCAARGAGADVIIRITSDSPLFDPTLLTAMLTQFQELRSRGVRLDYFSNTLVRTYPLGLGAEIFTMEALARVFAEAKKEYEREHVTPYFYQHPEIFALHSFTSPVDTSRYRWTLDTPEDFRMIQAVYRALYRPGEIMSTQQVVAFLESRPDVVALNAHVEQKKLPE